MTITSEEKKPQIDVLQVCLIDIEKGGTGKFNMDVYNIPPIISSRFVLTHEIELIRTKKSTLSANQRTLTMKLFEKVVKEK